jgi:hypothetical protein
MRLEDVIGTEDLIKYVKLELVKQTQKKKTMTLDLPENLFFKLMKLIMFCLRDKEERAKGEIDYKTVKFLVKINGTFTIVTRKNN